VLLKKFQKATQILFGFSSFLSHPYTVTGQARVTVQPVQLAAHTLVWSKSTTSASNVTHTHILC